VGDHDRVDSCANGLLEGRQLDGIEMGAIHIHAGDSEMGVRCRIAVAGEVLRRGQHSSCVRAFDVCGDEVSDLFRIFSKRTRIDNGIGGI
jgi:hypothetical protein